MRLRIVGPRVDVPDRHGRSRGEHAQAFVMVGLGPHRRTVDVPVTDSELDLLIDGLQTCRRALAVVREEEWA